MLSNNITLGAPAAAAQSNYILSDEEIITAIFIKDPWCTFPTDDQIGTQIRKTEPMVSDQDVARITEKLKPDLRARLVKEKALSFF
jgi:antirestriction protein ArdC